MDLNNDIATALDVTLDEIGEAKFQALKNLHARKIKSLMASVDAGQKEVVKLKALSKDNMRTQMIQALRKKIKDIELVVDVLKQELSVRGEMSNNEVTAFVMRKTIGGPKRFRPLTREELENKIFELEKKVADGEKKLARTVAAGGAAGGGGGTVAARNKTQTPASSAVGAAAGAGTGAAEVAALARATQEVEALQATLRGRNALIVQYKEEVARIRARNTELLAAEEEGEVAELRNDELRLELHRVKEELDASTKQLIAYHEDSVQGRSESAMEAELRHVNAEDLQEQCDKLLTYNATLLRRLGELEVELEEAVAAQDGPAIAKGAGTGAAGGAEGRLAALEAKHSRLQVKLKSTEEKLRAAEAELQNSATVSGAGAEQQVLALKATLRDKNEVIRDLTKQLKNASGGGAGGASSSSAAAAAAGGAGDKQAQAALQEQVAKLRIELRASEERADALARERDEWRDKAEDLQAELAMFDDGGVVSPEQVPDQEPGAPALSPPPGNGSDDEEPLDKD